MLEASHALREARFLRATEMQVERLQANTAPLARREVELVDRRLDDRDELEGDRASIDLSLERRAEAGFEAIGREIAQGVGGVGIDHLGSLALRRCYHPRDVAGWGSALSWLRLTWRLLAAGFVTFLAFLALTFGLPFRREPRARARYQDRVFQRWSVALLRVLGVRLAWDQPPPEGAHFLVSNHLGYLDIPVLASRIPCSFVAKSEIGSWPIAGPLCRSVDTLFIDRSRKRDLPRVLSEVRRLLDAGRTVAVFPEGTSGSGDGLLPFRSSLLDLPASLGVPVLHAALHYRAPPGWPEARHSVCWWGNAPLLPHLRTLLRLPWVEAHVRFAAAPLAESDRKRLSEGLAAAIARDLEILQRRGGRVPS